MAKPLARICVVAAALAIAPPWAARAASTAGSALSVWEVGTLTCTLAGETQGERNQPGQGREAVCTFRPGDRGAEETYVGTLHFIGRREQLSIRGTVLMTVKAPLATKSAPGLLQQSYAADASSAAEKQMPLVGQTNNGLVLHPEALEPGEPSLALGKSRTPQPMIITAELKLKSSPA
jgi:hypothetical protein